ncbi:arsenate reductase ArsC [Telluria aromaticivorans]|uniref:Arsenate reductase ArsC n=1 Tax=Telluria aromaticivorans TaxID=2725995 RepID=A0A7Y2JVR7_9BURK|nr:arsenate reductase ArsC [Telluria aromaticivorans]NNG21578.1 arsenate reductase ArsC [Telluria aromaticivorans]
MAETSTFNVLFLCTGNSSRSIIAEAILNAIGAGRFHAYSAGSHPTGSVHPLAMESIERLGFPSSDLRSKSWDEFAATDAPHMHFVITVCDRAAGEVCPRWPGHPITAHWSFQDPATFVGGEQEQRQLFSRVCREIKNRLDIFAMLPFEKLSRMAIEEELSAIVGPDSRLNNASP